MLKEFYYWFHRLTSNPEERDEYSGGYWQDRVRSQTVSLCKGIKGKILEIGCGEGLFLTQLAKQNPMLEIWGIDNNSQRLKQTEERLRKANLGNINLLIQDAAKLSFDNEYFDTVVCINVFFNMCSLTLVKETLNEMRRVCKKRGRIIFDLRSSGNPFLVAKYRLARYYDETVKNLPLNTYNIREIERILKDLNLIVNNKRFIGFPVKKLAPIIIIESEKR